MRAGWSLGRPGQSRARRARNPRRFPRVLQRSMSSSAPLFSLLAALGVALPGCVADPAGASPAAPPRATAPVAETAPAFPAPRILLFTRTTGFRHDSIPEAVRCVRELAAARGLEVEHTEDPAKFTPDNLARFGVVAFLNTSGDVLPERAQELAFERWLESGGRFLGVHAAADTEFNWPWYGRMVGAAFASHPRIQPAEQVVVDAAHPSVSHLPARWRRTDEWYNFRSFEPDLQVVLRLDESTYQGGKNGANHPSAWHKPVGRGRMFYTAGGHTKQAFAEPDFRRHLDGALAWLLEPGPPATPSPAAR